VTDSERRLAAAAACLAGPRAPALLARGASPEARAAAAQLAGRPREERLGALALATQDAPPAKLAPRAAALARLERPRLAALVSALARCEAPGDGVAPALIRLVHARLAR
jgi:hypothetical protein